MANNTKTKRAGLSGGKIFVSYRREDAADIAGRIRDWLVQVGHIPQANVFMDVTAILPGEDFMQVVDRAIAQCRTMFVVISPSWIGQVNSSPGAYVRLEVEAALRHQLRVIPLLVGGAKMPDASDMPESLRPLKALNARAVRPEDFDYDMQVVGRAIGVKRPQGLRGWQIAVSALVLSALCLGVLAVVPGNPVSQAFNSPSAIPTSTPVPPTSTPNNPYGVLDASLVLDDPLVDNSLGNQWSLPSDPAANCSFGSGGLHCFAQPRNSAASLPTATRFTSQDLHNVIFQVSAAFSQYYVDDAQFYDKSEFWLQVRAGNDIGYIVRFTSDGYYLLESAASNSGNILAQGPAIGFQTGNALNTISLEVQDTTLSLYVNFHLLTTVTDSVVKGSGNIVMAAAGPGDNSPQTEVTEVVFSQALVWVLP
jgi:hypothetical protein